MPPQTIWEEGRPFLLLTFFLLHWAVVCLRSWESLQKHMAWTSQAPVFLLPRLWPVTREGFQALFWSSKCRLERTIQKRIEWFLKEQLPPVLLRLACILIWNRVSALSGSKRKFSLTFSGKPELNPVNHSLVESHYLDRTYCADDPGRQNHND